MKAGSNRVNEASKLMRRFYDVPAVLEKLSRVNATMNCVEDYKDLLRQCRQNLALSDGRRVHAHITKFGYSKVTFLSNLLIQMYLDCGSLVEARITFDSMHLRNVFSWNFMISAYAKTGDFRTALDLYHRMDIAPNAFIFATALAACSSLAALDEGRHIHQDIKNTKGCEDDVVVQNALVTMYSRCGSLQEGRTMFDRMNKKNLISWNSMISAYVQADQPLEALGLYRRMKSQDLVPNGFVFASVLTACASLESLEAGSSVHQHIVAAGLARDMVVQNALVNMYAKCGSLDDAVQVLEAMEQRDVCTWTSIITAFAQQGHFEEALELYRRMSRDDKVQPNAATISGLLTSCSTLEQGRRIHAQAADLGLDKDVMVQTSLVSMYAKCGSLDDAESIFRRMESRDMISWSSMVAAYEQSGLPRESLKLYRKMLLQGMEPNQLTYCSVLQACCSARKLQDARDIHRRLVTSGVQIDNALRVVLINLYWRCNSLDEARMVFEGAVDGAGDTMTWTAMIKGYAERGEGQKALELYGRMKSEGVEPDDVTFAAIVDACGASGQLEEARRLLSEVSPEYSSSVVIGTSLVNLYSKSGLLEQAKLVFQEMPEKNICSWTALLRGYTRHKCYAEAGRLYHQMDLEGIEQTYLTYASVIPAFTSERSFHKGKAVHNRTRQLGVLPNPIVEAALVSLYCRCGTDQDMKALFDEMKHRSAETWNALIAAYNKHSRSLAAVTTYWKMSAEGVAPTAVTMTILVGICTKLKDLELGRAVHSRAAASGLLEGFVQNSLVNMYAKCGCLNEAREVFESMTVRNLVAWTAIIAAYSQDGLDAEALELYRRMDVEPDDITFCSVLNSCCKLGSLEDGQRVHDRVLRMQRKSHEVLSSDYVGTALVNMYARCGNMLEARKVFDSMRRTDAVSWSSIMTAYARHGDFAEVVELYRTMQSEGVDPDEITFISILASQSQAGRLEDALSYFGSITRDHGLSYLVEHYQCLVDLLARLGRLEEAEQVVNSMGTAVAADEVAWKSLLSACRDQDEVNLGARVAHKLAKLLPSDSASYVLLSQLYASSDVLERESLKEITFELERLVDKGLQEEQSRKQSD